MKVKEVAMVIALAILTALFVGLLVDAVYQEPKYEDFCRNNFPKAFPERGQCNVSVVNSEEVNKCYQDMGQPEFNYDKNGCETGFKSCNLCNKDFNTAQAKYNRNVFFIIAPIGIIAIIAGLFLNYEVVGSGFMFSGILLVAYATARYFSDMSKLFRVLVIFIELVLLIVISIKKLKK